VVCADGELVCRGVISVSECEGAMWAYVALEQAVFLRYRTLTEAGRVMQRVYLLEESVASAEAQSKRGHGVPGLT
jgi:hypothetical protein